MWKYDVIVFIQCLLLLNSLCNDENVKAANLSKHSATSKLKSNFYPNTHPLPKSPCKAREKLISDLQIKSGNYYGSKQNTCSHKENNNPSLESMNPDKSRNHFEEPPVATNIKVADAVVLENKDNKKAETIETIHIKVTEDSNDVSTEPTVTQEKEEVQVSESLDLEPNSPFTKDHKEDVAVEQHTNVSHDVESQPKLDAANEEENKADIDNKSEQEEKTEEEMKDSEQAKTEDDFIQPTVQPIELDDVTAVPPTTVTTPNPDEKPVRIVDDDDLQSFEEWKKNQIQSQEVAATAETTPPRQRTIRTKKTQMNYAAQDCGAKILSHNVEAKNVGAILDENKDLYMLNPCKERIWFVVELCEPIQIEQIQLANLELFSSMFHLFEIHISERYPARDWRSLGTFEARNERFVQTFRSKREDNMFAKYLKFEMKSYFGNEHFCPLTLIRVLGVSMVEEYENHEEEKNRKEQKNEDKSDQTDPHEKTGEAAGDAENSDGGGSIGNVLNIVKNVVGKMGNLLANGNSDADNSTNSIPDAAPIESTPENDSQDDVIESEWESPVTLVTNKSEVETTSSKRPIITLIETGDGQEVLSFDPTNAPLYPLKFLKRFSAKTFGTKLCWFLEFMYRVSILSCVAPHGNHTVVDGAFPFVFEEEASPKTITKKNTTIQETPPESKPNFVLVDKTKRVDNGNDESKTNSPPSLDSKPFIKDTPNSTKIGKPNVTISDKLDTLNVSSAHEMSEQPDKSDNEVDSGRNETLLDEFKRTIAKNDDENPICDKKVDKSSQKSEKNEKDEKFISESEPPPPKKDSDSVNVEKSSESEDTAAKAASPSVVQPSEDENPKISEESAQEEPPTESPELEQNAIPDNNEDASTPPIGDEASAGKNVASAIPSLSEQITSETEDTVVINPGTNQKESVLMRLSNRIRALEQNLSLSSAYLENLSRRYKRQMDEMQRAFNQTQSRLKEMSAIVEENNIKHTQAINLEDEKQETLRIKCDDLETSTEQLNHDMVARHFCLMALESIILIVLFVTCYGAREARLIHKVEETQRKVELLLLNQAKNSNGYSKLHPSSNHTKRSKMNDESSAGHKIGDGRLKAAAKSKSTLINNVSSWSVSPPCPTLSNTSLQRKKGIGKTLGSPIRKRKNNHGGKMLKSNKNTNKEISSGVTSGDSKWTTDLSKSQKFTKIKKNECRNGRVPNEISSRYTLVYSNKGKANNIPQSACKDPSFWQKCTWSLSTAFVGKAR